MTDFLKALEAQVKEYRKGKSRLTIPERDLLVAITDCLLELCYKHDLRPSGRDKMQEAMEQVRKEEP